MATRQYDIGLAGRHYDIADSEGGAISDAVRVTIDLAVVTSRLQALEALERLRMRLVDSPWPPA
jgi:hypothetical protein